MAMMFVFEEESEVPATYPIRLLMFGRGGDFPHEVKSIFRDRLLNTYRENMGDRDRTDDVWLKLRLKRRQIWA